MKPNNILSQAYTLFPDEIWVHILIFHPQFNLWCLLNRDFYSFSLQYRNIVWEHIHHYQMNTSRDYNKLATCLELEFPIWFHEQRYETITHHCFQLLPKLQLFMVSDLRRGLYQHLHKLLPHEDDDDVNNTPLRYWELETLYHSQIIIEIKSNQNRCNPIRARPANRNEVVGNEPYVDPTEPLTSKTGGCADVPCEWVREKGYRYWQYNFLIAQLKLSELHQSVPSSCALRTVPNYGMLLIIDSRAIPGSNMFRMFYYPSENPQDYIRIDPDDRQRPSSISPSRRRSYYIGNHDCHVVESFQQHLSLHYNEFNDKTYETQYLPRYRIPGLERSLFPDFKLLAFRYFPEHDHWIVSRHSLIPNYCEVDEQEALIFLHLASTDQFVWGDLGYMEIFMPKRNQSIDPQFFNVSSSKDVIRNT